MRSQSWPNGFEAWCSLHGSYLTFIRDESAALLQPYLDICQLGIFADTDSKLTVSLGSEDANGDIKISVAKGKSLTLELQTNDANLQSSLKLRQSPGFELDFMTITNDDTGSPTINISFNDMNALRSLEALTTYDFVFEIFATYQSGYEEVFQTSTAILEIDEPSIFTDLTPDPIQLSVGEDFNLSLPLDETHLDLIDDIEVDLGDAYKFINFDQDTFEFKVESVSLTDEFVGTYLLVTIAKTTSGQEHYLYQGLEVLAQQAESEFLDSSQDEADEQEDDIEMLDEVIIQTGEEITWLLSVPEDSNMVETYIDMGNADTFVEYSVDSSTFSTIGANTIEGDYFIKIEIKLDDGSSRIFHQVIRVIGQTSVDNQEVSLYTFEAELEQQRQQEALEPVLAKLTEVTSSGLLTLRFSRDVEINRGYLNVVVAERNSSNQNQDEGRRQLNELSQDQKEALTSQFQFNLYSDVRNQQQPALETFDITQIRSSTVEFQLHFSHVTSISVDSLQPDKLTCEISPYIFTDPQTHLYIDVTSSLEIELPRMMEVDFAEDLRQKTTVGTETITAISTLNIMIMLLFGVSLKAIWSVINTLQLLIFYTEIKANLAPHPTQFLEILKTVALFQFVPYKWLTDEIKSWLNENAEFDEEDVFDSTGSMIVIGFGIGLVALLTLLATLLCKNYPKCYNVLTSIKKKLYWNSFIRYSLQSYLKLAFANATVLGSLKWASHQQTSKSLTVLLAIAVLAALPFFYILVLLRNRTKLKEEEIMLQIGSLSLGIRNYNWMQSLYSVVFLLRRVAFVSILLGLKDQPAIAINLVLLLNIAFVTYFCSVNPHDNIFTHRREIANEALLQIITYHLALSMLSTGVVYDAILGWSMIMFVVLLFTSNILLVSITTVKTLQWKYYLKQLKKQKQSQTICVHEEPIVPSRNQEEQKQMFKIVEQELEQIEEISVNEHSQDTILLNAKVTTNANTSWILQPQTETPVKSSLLGNQVSVKVKKPTRPISVPDSEDGLMIEEKKIVVKQVSRNIQQADKTTSSSIEQIILTNDQSILNTTIPAPDQCKFPTNQKQAKCSGNQTISSIPPQTSLKTSLITSLKTSSCKELQVPKRNTKSIGDQTTQRIKESSHSAELTTSQLAKRIETGQQKISDLQSQINEILQNQKTSKPSPALSRR